MAGNPYRDENGKYCSKGEMFSAVTRLHEAGKTDEAATLFGEYLAASDKEKKEAEKQEKADLAAAAKKDREAVAAAAKEAKTVQKNPPRGTILVGDNVSAEQKAQVFAQFVEAYDIGAGDRTVADDYKFYSQVSDAWDRQEGPYEHLEAYDPLRRGQVQFLMDYTDWADGSNVSKTLIAYDGGLYSVNQIISGDWSNKVEGIEAVSTTPRVTAGTAEKKYVRDETRTGKSEEIASGWAKANGIKVHDGWISDPSKDAPVKFISHHSVETEEGIYRRQTVWQDKNTGDLIGVTYVENSWDNGEDDITSYSFQFLEEKTFRSAGRLHFPVAVENGRRGW